MIFQDGNLEESLVESIKKSIEERKANACST